ncbi:response regulator [Patescibacteria group bacterium]|nr:response regulator [Patescibacteria group bacterium]
MQKMLIVEDDAALGTVYVQLFPRIFARLGKRLNVVHTTEGVEAMRLLRSEHFDVVVCDINFPGATALDIYRITQSLNPSPLFIANSGDVHHADYRELQRLNAHAVSKPVGIDEFERIFSL